MHIQFLKQNKKEILNWVEVTGRAIQTCQPQFSHPSGAARSELAFREKHRKRGLCNKRKCSSFHSSERPQDKICFSFLDLPATTSWSSVSAPSKMLHTTQPMAVSHAATVPSQQLKHWPLRSYKCYFSFNILILMSLEVINSTMSLGPCLFAHHLLLM